MSHTKWRYKIYVT